MLFTQICHDVWIPHAMEMTIAVLILASLVALLTELLTYKETK